LLVPGLPIGKDDSQRPGYLSNAFNPGQPVHLRRFFLLEMELVPNGDSPILVQSEPVIVSLSSSPKLHWIEYSL